MLSYALTTLDLGTVTNDLWPFGSEHVSLVTLCQSFTASDAREILGLGFFERSG
jgi:hypothetical protein